MFFQWAVLLAALLSFSGLVSAAQIDKAKPREVHTRDKQSEPTNTWAMHVAPGVDPQQMARRYGLEYVGPIGTLDDYYLFRMPEDEIRLFEVQQMREEPQVLWLEQQKKRKRYKRLPQDPLFPDQWHLHNTGQYFDNPGVDVNVIPAWDNGLRGDGIQIAIVDDGLEHTHPDLAPNYTSVGSWDFNEEDSDPAPLYAEDRHGTAVAGVAAARDDGSSCGVGSAYRSRLAGIRLIAEPSTDAMEAQALTYAYQSNQIFNNSWGPEDDAERLEGPGTLTRLALADGVKNGRGGLGSIYVWAGGNGRAMKDNVNYDGYANSRFTIAVGAVDYFGKQANYSEPGAPLLIASPSSGSGPSICTTDLIAPHGYENSANCTADFGGTSSAAPLVSGVISLMLEVNPELSWLDVQRILGDSTVKNDPQDPGWMQNGAGRWINHKYGLGMIDAQKAVELARQWRKNKDYIAFESTNIVVDKYIPDNDPTGVSSQLYVTHDFQVEHVEVVFSATHPYRGDLEIVLTSPDGTPSVLAQKHVDSNPDYPGWKFMSVRHWGEFAKGIWTLKVSDGWEKDTGTFDSWRIILHGTEGEDEAKGLLPGVYLLLGDE